MPYGRTSHATIDPKLTKTWQCPGCFWSRTYSTDPLIFYRRFIHPLWGDVTGETLVRLDIINHDCLAAALAHERAVTRRKPVASITRDTLPPADPEDPPTRLLRAVFGACPVCDRDDPHEHPEES